MTRPSRQTDAPRNRRARRVIVAAFLTGVVLSALPAATLRVPADYPFLHRALVAAEPGDTIELGPGTYPIADLTLDRPLTFLGAGPDQTHIVLSNASNHPLKIVGIGTADHPVVFRALSFRDDGAPPEFAGRYRLLLDHAHATFDDVEIGSLASPFLEATNSRLQLKRMRAAALTAPLLRLRVEPMEAGNLAYEALEADADQLPAILATTPTFVALNDSDFAYAPELNEPPLIVSDTAWIQIERVRLPATAQLPFCIVENAFATLSWPEATSTNAAYLNGAQPGGPTPASLANADPSQFSSYGGMYGPMEDPNAPTDADRAAFYALRRTQAAALNAALPPLTDAAAYGKALAAGLAPVLTTPDHPRRDDRMHQFDRDWLTAELTTFIDAHGDDAAARLIAFTLPAPPDQGAPAFYGSLIPRYDADGNHLLHSLANAQLQAQLAGNLTDRLAARRAQLAGPAASSPAALLQALHDLETYVTTELGITPDATQLADLKHEALALLDSTLATQSPGFARDFHQALLRSRFTFARSSELVAAQSAAARRPLFDAYRP